jgi:hypothetical protein
MPYGSLFPEIFDHCILAFTPPALSWAKTDTPPAEPNRALTPSTQPADRANTAPVRGSCGITVGRLSGTYLRRLSGRLLCSTLRPLRPSPSGGGGPQAPVAQLDRALPSEGRGRTFESCRVRHSLGIGTLFTDKEVRTSLERVRHSASASAHRSLYYPCRLLLPGYGCAPKPDGEEGQNAKRRPPYPGGGAILRRFALFISPY